jgi:adenine-specific DNA-methyltransferase
MSYRYIGNKTRLIPHLLSAIRDNLPRGGTVADPMCGTASVSEGLRRAGYRVIASDLMTYSVHHARVRLLLDSDPKFEGLGSFTYWDVLGHLEGLPPFEGVIFREYSPAGKPEGGYPPRGYFTAENAGRIDAITREINRWESEKRLTVRELSLLRHDLILAANRVANIAGTYGHFRSKWSNGSLSPLQLLPTEFVWGYSCGHVVLQGPVEALAASIQADLCYLDPPYMKRQYAANYHLVETIARGDAPEAVGVSGLRPWRDQYSDFCSKVRIRDSFRRAILEMDCPLFLISYSEDGLLSEQEMTALLEEFGTVTLTKIPFQRFRSNDSPLGSTVTEFLFCLRKA